MLILQINTVDTRGGAAQVAYGLKRELEKRGHQSPMFVGRKYSNDPNVFVLNDVLSFSGKVRRKLAYWFANDIDIFSSDHILETEQFKKADIVHCHNLHGNYFNLSTLEKISRLKPVVWTFHDMWPLTAHCAHAFDGALKNGFFTCPNLDIPPSIAWHNEKHLERRKGEIYKNSNFHIVTPSKWLANKTKQSILKDKPLSVFYNGIDISIFKPYDKIESRQSLDLPLDKRIVLVVAKGGASNPWKGGNYAQEAVKAFKDDPGVFFVCLGGDIAQANPRLKTVSYTANQAILAKYYSAADMLLYPSIADNCPLVVLEAHACGLPVVSFDTGGIPELVNHQKTDYIAHHKDVDELINGIKWMLSRSPVELTAISETLIIKIRSGFSLDTVAEQYLELYKSLIK
jgi:glycosyltransferase involved in cell wall biosynthesis